MTRLDERSEAAWGGIDDSPSLLIIVDKDIEGLLDKLGFNSTLSWDKFTLLNGSDNIKGMLGEDKHRRNIYQYTTVLIAAGLSDILSGSDGLKAANKMLAIVPKFKELKVKVAICQLPPALDRKATNIKCFNMKISSTDVQVIRVENVFDYIKYNLKSMR